MGNFSRNTFDKVKHYVGVRLQQGVPIVDADWNELEDIRKYELQAFLKWFVGNGIPKGNDGFHIRPADGQDNDFVIKAGRCLVEGWDVINEIDINYTAQHLSLTTPTSDRTDIVYLDVWEREVNAVEDPYLVNPAIGIETCVRLKREWVVRVAEGAELPNPPEGHFFYTLASLKRSEGQSKIKDDDISDQRRTGLSILSQDEIKLIVPLEVQQIKSDIQQNKDALSLKLDISDYNAKDVLNKLLTVDENNSGLNANFLQEYSIDLTGVGTGDLVAFDLGAKTLKKGAAASLDYKIKSSNVKNGLVYHPLDGTGKPTYLSANNTTKRMSFVVSEDKIVFSFGKGFSSNGQLEVFRELTSDLESIEIYSDSNSDSKKYFGYIEDENGTGVLKFHLTEIQPIFSKVQPTTQGSFILQNGQIWHNTNLGVTKKYNGSTWDDFNAITVGYFETKNSNAVIESYRYASVEFYKNLFRYDVGEVIKPITNKVPEGFALEKGQTILRGKFPDLFNYLGAIYGGDGTNNFKLRDPRGYFERIWANSSNVDPDRASRINRGDGTTGDNVGTGQKDQLGTHSHYYLDRQDSNIDAVNAPAPTTAKAGSTDARRGTESSGGNETRPVNIYVASCIFTGSFYVDLLNGTGT
jgi:microcystin-dependent protein